MDFVGGVGIPDDELSILRGGDQMPSVCRPVHGIDLRKMALESAFGLHGQAREGLDTLLCHIAHCEGRELAMEWTMRAWW